MYTTVPDFTWMLDDGSLQPALRYLIPVVHAELDSSGVQLVARKCQGT